MSQSLGDKEAFFRDLDRLDSPSDPEGRPEDDLAHLLDASKTKPQRTEPMLAGRARLATPPTPSQRPLETRSSPAPEIRRLEVNKKPGSVSGDSAQKPELTRSATTGSLTENNTAKRKRKASTRVIPDQRQVFRGLVFFFFPNSDVSPLRRLRIQRAQEYGAEWTRTCDNRVTHIVVDKGLTFQDAVTHLKIDSLSPTIALVDESYPSECIKFQSILSPAQARFRVSGAPLPSQTETVTAIRSPSSDDPMPIKATTKERENDAMTPQISADHCELQRNAPDTPSKETSEQYIPMPSGRERDALDDIIDTAKAAKDLPLEPLDTFYGEPAAGASDTDNPEDSDTQQVQCKKKRIVDKIDNPADGWQQSFACMQKHDLNTNTDNPNRRTIDVLQQMLEYYTSTDDHWRVLAYRKAITALRKQKKKITTKSQALLIAGIGPRLADKIEEIVVTNRLRRLENTNATPEDQLLQKFLKIYGVGLGQASRWVAQGYKSLEDLKNKASLTRQQRIGLEHYSDFCTRIPRQEVEAHGKIVREAVQAVDTDMQVIIGGSYRRGAKDCGDIDLLITKPSATGEQIRTLMLDTIVPELLSKGFLQASLAVTSREDGSKWHGASVVPGSETWRRIDLLFVPGAEIGAALLYFTGNDIFNRSMRLLASKKGMRLNQRGLYADVLRGPQRVKLNSGRLLEGRDERRIFEILGVPWRPPEHRIC